MNICFHLIEYFLKVFILFLSFPHFLKISKCVMFSFSGSFNGSFYFKIQSLQYRVNSIHIHNLEGLINFDGCKYVCESLFLLSTIIHVCCLDKVCLSASGCETMAKHRISSLKIFLCPTKLYARKKVLSGHCLTK